MQAKLVVVGGDAKAAEVKLKLPTVIGRGRDATLMLPHPLVSRQHCEIFEREGQLVVRDLGSLNGTYVGKERVSEAVLAPGELLTIGTVTFRAVYDQPSEQLLPPGAVQAEYNSYDGFDETLQEGEPGTVPVDDRPARGKQPAELEDSTDFEVVPEVADDGEPPAAVPEREGAGAKSAIERGKAAEGGSNVGKQDGDSPAGPPGEDEDDDELSMFLRDLE